MSNSMRVVLFFFLLLLCPAMAWGQDTAIARIFPIKNGNIHFESNVTIDSTKKEEIFKLLKAYCAEKVVNGAINLNSDLETGLISITQKHVQILELPPVKGQKIISNITYLFDFKILITEFQAKIVVDNILINNIQGKDVSLAYFRAMTLGTSYLVKKDYLKKELQAIDNNYIDLKDYIETEINACVNHIKINIT